MAIISEISELLSYVFKLVPRIQLVDPNEAGVRITLGTRITDLEPGWYVYWPLIQNIEIIPTKTQVKDLRAQSVRTHCRHDMTVSGAIRYRVKSAARAILDVEDYDANIQAVALGIIQRFVGEKQIEELRPGEVEIEVARGLREECQGWGLKIESVYITDIGETQNFRVLLNEPVVGAKVE